MVLMGRRACEVYIQQLIGIKGQLAELLVLYHKTNWSLLQIQKSAPSFFCAVNCVPDVGFDGDCFILVYLMGMSINNPMCTELCYSFRSEDFNIELKMGRQHFSIKTKTWWKSTCCGEIHNVCFLYSILTEKSCFRLSSSLWPFA